MPTPANASSTHEDEFIPHTLDETAAVHSKISSENVALDGEVANLVVDTAYSPPIGLSTEDANKRIIKLLTESLKTHERNAREDTYFKLILRKDLFVGALCSIGLIVLIVTYENNRRKPCVIYLMLLCCWLVVNALVKLTTNRIRNSRVGERVKDILTSFSSDITISFHAELEQKRFSFDPPNSVLTPVYRNREWKRLPTNVLVKGDVFKLKLGEVFPCDCRLITKCDNEGNITLGEEFMKYGDVCSNVGTTEPAVELIDGCFIAESDAMVPQLNAFLDCKLHGNPFVNLGLERNVFSQLPESSGKKMKNSIWDFSDSIYFSKLSISFGEMATYLLMTVILFTSHMEWYGLHNWQGMVYSLLSLICCLAFPGFDPFLQLADIWGNVKLQSLFNWHNEKRLTVDISPQLSSSSSSTLVSTSKAGSVDTEMDASLIPLANQLKEFSKVLHRGLDSAGSLLHVLSSVTLLCFVDDVGLITEGCATIQEIAIIRGNEVVKSPRKCRRGSPVPSSSLKEATPNADGEPKEGQALISERAEEYSRELPPSSVGEELVILDVYSDSSQYGKQYVRFNNDYERSCLPHILPLAFAMSVAQFPRYQPPSLFRMPPALIYSYVGMISNEAFIDFTDCLCTFTGSIGLKRSFSRRFRLMRFVILIDEAHGEEGKLLLFFLRDPRKQIVQMVAKGKLEMLLERNINCHNHQLGTINGVNRVMKRKLKDLNMQWVSSGMVSFAYAYKPIHLDDFNMLMAHLDATTVFNVKPGKTEGRRKRKYMYMEDATPISMQYGGECIYTWFKQLKKPDNDHVSSETWEGIPKEVKTRIVKGCAGDMVSACLKNTVLLGMSANKRLYPKEVPSRIQSFHEAGVRFVYFSKHDERQTRVAGAHLGLETSWNSMISLSNSARSTYINQEGNVVLPSGIENIKRHIEEVDDIPLQVSLFANCSPENTAEMLRILRNNGETIMCIGGGLRPSNFNVFREAHSSLSVAQGYHPVCRFCKGKRWSGVARAHIFDEALPELKLSAALTSLPCDLQTSTMYKVGDPYYVMEMIYEVLRVARHLSTNIQEASAFLKLACHSLAWLLVLQAISGYSSFLRIIDFALTLFVYIPLISLSLLSNPASNDLMATLPNKIHSDDLNVKPKSILRTYPRLCLATTFVGVLHCLCLVFMSSMLYTEFERHGSTIELGKCSSYYKIPQHDCTRLLESEIIKIRERLGPNVFIVQPKTLLYMSQLSSSLVLVIYLIVASSSWIDKYGDGGRGVFGNFMWMLVSAGVFSCQLAVVVSRLYMTSTTIEEILLIYPFKHVGVVAAFGVVIIIFDQLIKLQIRRDRNIEQKFLKLLFSTRLGMWSPK
ncbi:hypothetical protein BgAZ_106580 [Babesia gibsoni]|uniref:Uncharacterized protein n=1 Tax=Babesia gibsoni TaxID=33632 RepID=A0AAD8PG68_BABGI|nr:hypothetical protein BgAZ_106580 [Babesia gibsoni]